MTDVLTSLTGTAYFQIAPGKQPEYIGSCFDADALPDPQGDRDPVRCYDQNGRWITVAITQTPPDKITTVLTGLQDKSRTKAEEYKERHCPFVFYGSQKECGRTGVFNNFDKMYGVTDVTMTDTPLTDWMMRETDNPTTAAYNLTGMPGRVDMRKFVVMTKVSDSDQDMLSLAVRDYRCASACGDIIQPGYDVIFGGTGAVAATPDVQRTQNQGNPADVANFPFAVDENVESLVRFMVNATTERWVAARESDGVGGWEVAYTDDGAATAWNNVTVGTTIEGATGPQALFALDYEHIWGVASAGGIYFSSDGGLTWTAQFDGTALNAVHCINDKCCVAVGDADEMYYTVNGGTTWGTLTGTGGGGDLLTVQMLSRTRWVVGTDDADIWMSWDSGANWTQQIDFGAGTVSRVHFWNPGGLDKALSGIAIYNTAAPLGTVYQTSDGGYSWEAKTTPTNQGLTDAEMFSPNGAWVAGRVGAGAIALPMLVFG